jgi:protein-S-isoprenylcysteine O-methyltransferase Ste14
MWGFHQEEIDDMLELAGIATLILGVATVGLWKYRDDYKRYRRTTALGVLAILAAFTMPNLVVGIFVPWIGLPETTLQVVGWVLLIGGLGLCLIAMIRFRSPRKVLGLKTEGVVSSGIYRYTRNPQYIFYGVFLLGWVLCGDSPRALLGFAFYLVVVHFTILIEEEHLTKVYGEAYLDYKKATPRYLGL